MGNIDEKRLSALLERIGNMKAELEALEEEVRALGTISGSAEKSVNEPERSQMPAFDETPIDISIQDIDISPVIEDPAAEYAASPMVAEHVEATAEPSELAAPIAEPAEATAEPAELAAPVAEPVEATGQAVNAVPDDLPFDDDFPADEPSAVPEPISEPTLDIEPEIVINPTSEEPTPKPKAAILDSGEAGMENRPSWLAGQECHQRHLPQRQGSADQRAVQGGPYPLPKHNQRFQWHDQPR